MGELRPLLRSRKRKRRRPDKPSISARLVLDDHVKGDVGIISEDLFADLFPSSASSKYGSRHTHDKRSPFEQLRTRMIPPHPKFVMSL
jgi:hypothetical protein